MSSLHCMILAYAGITAVALFVILTPLYFRFTLEIIRTCRYERWPWPLTVLAVVATPFTVLVWYVSYRLRDRRRT